MFFSGKKIKRQTRCLKTPNCVIMRHLEAADVLVDPADHGGVVAGAVQQVADEDVQRRQRQLRRVLAGPPAPPLAGAEHGTAAAGAGARVVGRSLPRADCGLARAGHRRHGAERLLALRPRPRGGDGGGGHGLGVVAAGAGDRGDPGRGC